MAGDDPAARVNRQPLFVLFAYRGADRDGPLPTGRLAEWLRLPEIIAHRRVHRDFYANPRNLHYQLALVSRQVHAGTAPLLIIDQRLEAAVAAAEGLAPSAYQLADLEADTPADAIRAAGEVYLVYQDALGLGCEFIERALMRGADGRCWSINGRRRVFRLTPRMRRRLALSRWLARSRAGEYAAALAVTLAGYVLAGWDHLRGRR